jgi:hypothetical protein
MIVKVGTIISSPLPISRAAIAISSAAEPLDTAIPCFRLTPLENLDSNLETYGPSEEIHPDSMHSFRYLTSLPRRDGSETAYFFIFRLTYIKDIKI